VRQPDTGHEAFYHPGALLPRIVLSGNSSGPDQVAALRVESIADFLQANGFRAEIEGGPLSPLRRALVSAENGVDLTVVERRGTGDYEPVYPEDAYVRIYLEAMEAWQKRPRTGDNEEQIFQEIFRIADRLVRQLGPDMAAHVVCLCERTYWLSRNFAARMQQGRQDTLGLGLANHDHHTFRSSRRNFSRLVSLFIRLGFKNRERFYAGAEAGWGAQVMENPAAGLTLFLDVDLAPEEVATEFDFERLIADLARHGVGYMAPFSNFPYLKQAFSVAERWEVDPPRVEKLVRDKAITAEQSERFLSQGAVGSHLEDIERREGYKGFNRKNVSAIIRETDPRRHVV
jgi:hypothetical protein